MRGTSGVPSHQASAHSSLLLRASGSDNNSIRQTRPKTQLHDVASKHGAAAQSVAHRRIGKVRAVHHPDAAR